MNKCPHCNAKIYSSVATRCSNCHLKISISDSDIKAINLHKYDNLNKFIGGILAIFISTILIILINNVIPSNRWILRLAAYSFVLFFGNYLLNRNYIKTKQQKL
jgi:hypothetical protein